MVDCIKHAVNYLNLNETRCLLSIYSQTKGASLLVLLEAGLLIYKQIQMDFNTKHIC